MKLGVFAMIPQLNAKVLNGNHQRQKSSYSNVKTMLVCFYESKGVIHHEFVPERQTVTGSFYFECSGTPMEEDSPCPARVLSTRQLVSSSRQCTGSPGSCCTRIFSPKTSVRAPSSAPLPWFIPLWLFSVPQTEVTIERASVWKCSRHPSICDIESSGHTTRRHAEVLLVFARSCHLLYQCRRDVLWIKYREYSSLLFQFYSVTSVSLHNCQTLYVRPTIEHIVWTIVLASSGGSKRPAPLLG